MNFASKLLEKINQKRTQRNLRILWPDFQVHHLIEKEIQLASLHSYCHYESFRVVKATLGDYLSLRQVFQDFSHAAFYFCSNNSDRQSTFFTNELRKHCESERPLHVERTNLKNENNYPEQDSSLSNIFLILSKRAIVIDQIVKTNHKIAISLIPISQSEYLWGGNIQFHEFEQPTKESTSLFEEKVERNYGFNISSNQSPNIAKKQQPFRHSIKRHSRYSNFFSSQSLKEQTVVSQLKQCSNSLKLHPQNISTHKQFLYIEAQLINNPNLSEKCSHSFEELILYGRRYKPIYGSKYEDESQGEDLQERFKKEEIFNIYNMPFKTFGSYLDSQLKSQILDFKQLSFKGLQIDYPSFKVQPGSEQRSKYGYKLQTSKKKKISEESQNLDDNRSLFNQQVSTNKKFGRSSTFDDNFSQFSIKEISYSEMPKPNIFKTSFGKEYKFTDNDWILSDKLDKFVALMNKDESLKYIEEYVRDRIQSNEKKYPNISSEEYEIIFDEKKESQGQIEKVDFITLSVRNPHSFKAEHHELEKKKILLLNPEIEKETIVKKIGKSDHQDFSKSKDGQIQIFLGSKLYERATTLHLSNLISAENPLRICEFLEKIEGNFQEMTDLIKLCEDMKLALLSEILHLQIRIKLSKDNDFLQEQINRILSSSESHSQTNRQLLSSFQVSFEKTHDLMVKYWFLEMYQIIESSLRSQDNELMKIYFLLNCSSIMQKHSYEFKKICSLEKVADTFIEILEFTLEHFEKVPFEVLYQKNHLKTQGKDCNLYSEILSDLLEKYLAIKGIKNIVEYFNLEHQKLLKVGCRNEIVFGSSDNQVFEGKYQNISLPKIYAAKKEFYETYKNKQVEKLKQYSEEKSNKDSFSSQKPSSQTVHRFQYKIFQEDGDYQSAQTSNTTIFSKPFFSASQSKSLFGEPHKTTYGFSLSIDKQGHEVILQLFALPNVFPENIVVGSGHRVYNCWKVEVFAKLNSEYGFKGQQLCTFLSTSQTSHRFRLKEESQDTQNVWDTLFKIDEKQAFKHLQVEIRMVPAPVYEASLTFLNMRLPKYLKSLRSYDQTSKNERNIRKTIGGRLTSHLNKRKSVLNIQDYLQEGNGEISRIYEIDEITLFQLLRTDRNYIQHESNILKFIMEYYKRNEPRYGEYILLSQIRPRYVSGVNLMESARDNEKLQSSKIFQELMKMRLSLKSQNNIYGISLKPRISSVMPLKNVLNSKYEQQLLMSSLKQKRNSKSKMKKKDEEINIPEDNEI